MSEKLTESIAARFTFNRAVEIAVIAEEKGVSAAEIIRIATDAYLDSQIGFVTRITEKLRSNDDYTGFKDLPELNKNRGAVEKHFTKT